VGNDLKGIGKNGRMNSNKRISREEGKAGEVREKRRLLLGGGWGGGG